MESRRTWLGRLDVVLVVAQLALFVSAQDCLLATEEMATPFTNATYSRNRIQVIVTGYKFGCCGNITTWQTNVRPAGEPHQRAYDINFQVWRPSPTVQENGCYSMVGENRYTSIFLGRGGLVSETPEPSNILSVQPGDVVGFYSVNRRKVRVGLQLNNKQHIDGVWYHHNRGSRPLTLGASDCPFPVGTEIGRSLTLSTNVAPVLTVGMSSFSCPVTSTMSPTSSFLSPSKTATGTSMPSQINYITPQPLPTLTYLPLSISEPTLVLSESVSSHSGLTRPSSIESPILTVGISLSISSPAPKTSSVALRSAIIASTLGGSVLLLILLSMAGLAITIAKVQDKRARTLAEISSVVTDQQVHTLSMQGNEAYTTTSYSNSEHSLPESQLYESMSIASEVDDLYEGL